MPYKIGERLWFKGNEVEIVSGPYMLYGAEWQDAKRLDGGVIVTLRTARNKPKGWLSTAKPKED